jgi:hypothetical protein
MRPKTTFRPTTIEVIWAEDDNESPKYRAHMRYKNWIGKPDPSGFGDYYVISDSMSWLDKEVEGRVKCGDRLLGYERSEDGKWKRIKREIEETAE